MVSILCECGKEKESLRKKLCDDCRNENKRLKNLLDARKHRQRHGSKVRRGIYCSRCKGVKEHQDRGYCLACERDRYKEKSKPDCATCGSMKDNPRDAYCNKCKNAKTALKSTREGRRSKNKDGRKATCSSCGKVKGERFLNESYCWDCKYKFRKARTVSEEQRYKEAVRKLTWKKIREGILIRQPCEVCGNDKVEAHHDDYMKPLEVRWLCRNHHQEHHNNLIEGN